MKKWFLIGVVSLLGIPVLWMGFPSFGLAQRMDPFRTDTQKLIEQYKTLKEQSLALVEKVEHLQQERERFQGKVKSLKKLLKQSEKVRNELEDQYVSMIQTVSTLQENRNKLMTDQGMTQKLAKALQGETKILKRRQNELGAKLKEAGVNYRYEKDRNREAAKKITRLQRAMKANERANLDLQMQVVELQSLSRESRIAFNYELGRVYVRSGMYDAAISEFQKTLEVNPNYADSYRELGEIYREHLMRADLASPFFRRYLELRPEASDFGQIKGWIIKAKKEIDTRISAKRWGTGFFRNFSRIFF